MYLQLRYAQDSWKCHQPGRDEPALDPFKAIIEKDDRIMIIPVSLQNEILESERGQQGHRGNENTETRSLQGIAAPGTNSALAEAGTAPRVDPVRLLHPHCPPVLSSCPVAGNPGSLHPAGGVTARILGCSWASDTFPSQPQSVSGRLSFSIT